MQSARCRADASLTRPPTEAASQRPIAADLRPRKERNFAYLSPISRALLYSARAPESVHFFQAQAGLKVNLEVITRWDNAPGSNEKAGRREVIALVGGATACSRCGMGRRP